MVKEQSEFWSKIAQKYDRVVDLQIGPKTRAMVRERVTKEGWLGNLAEFGCGTGFYTRVLAGKADSVLATDVSPAMLEIAKDQIKDSNVTFQAEDCQKTSFHDGAFDTAFLSLVIHFTEPDKTLAEMRRILKRGGTLIIANVDPHVLNRLDRVRCHIRVLYHGATGYRIKPPKGFGKNTITKQQLCGLLEKSGFKVFSIETISDTSRSSNIPIDYIRAMKV
jgi:ubiquinone/menaquinone biosynthesis C-methylase UbiE